jgi:hypothetical protein
MLITRVLPNSVRVPTRVTTRPFGLCLSGTARRTTAERQRGRGFGLGAGVGAGGSSAATVVSGSGAGFAEAADSAE